jgi:hypothetical protein
LAGPDAIVERRSGQPARKRFFCFYGFACQPLLRIKIWGRFSWRKTEMINEFSFANRMSIYRVVASRCVAAINLNFTDL